MKHWFTLSGVQKYDTAQDLEHVPSEIETMRKAFSRLGLEELCAFDAPTRSHRELCNDLIAWADDREVSGDTDEETLAIYSTGHGVVANQVDFYLLDQGTGRTAPHELLKAVASKKTLTQVLVIVDACFSGDGADDVIMSAHQRMSDLANKNVWTISASRRLEFARQNEFVTAFSKGLDKLILPSFERKYVDFEKLVKRIKFELENQQATAEGPVGFAILLNPEYQRKDPQSKGFPISGRWLMAARGVTKPGVPGFMFTGRVDELDAVRNHMSGKHSGIAVVTGPLGSGKSALLGQAVLTAWGGNDLPTFLRRRWPRIDSTVVCVNGEAESALDQISSAFDKPGDPRYSGSTCLVADIDGPADDAFVARLRAIADQGVPVVIGISNPSDLLLRNASVVLSLDAAAVEDVQAYLQLRHQLASAKSPSRPDSFIRRITSAGPGFHVAAAGADSYYQAIDGGGSAASAEASAEMDAIATAHRTCRDLLYPLLQERRTTVVETLSLLSSFDPGIYLSAPEWSSVASKAGAPVAERDIERSAQLLGGFVIESTLCSGERRWRATFPPIDRTAPRRLTELERLVGFLPYFDRTSPPDWSSLDQHIRPLVAWGAAMQLADGRLIDDHRFLMHAPTDLIAQAARYAPGSDRTGRANVASALRLSRDRSDRALLLDVAAKREGIVLTGLSAEDDAHFRYRAEWVQRARRADSALISLTVDSAERIAVTVDAKDTIEFWDVSSGQALRNPVTLAHRAVPHSVRIVRSESGSTVVLSTTRGEIQTVACNSDGEPVSRVDLASMLGSPPTPIEIAEHSDGRVIFGSGTRLVIADLDGLQSNSVINLDFRLHSIVGGSAAHCAGAWAVGIDGHVRKLNSHTERECGLGFFPLSRRPHSTSASIDGTQLLVVDVAGSVVLYGNTNHSNFFPRIRRGRISSSAVTRERAVIGIAAESRGASIHLIDIATGRFDTVILDRVPVGLRALSSGRVLVAQPSGMWLCADTRDDVQGVHHV